MHRSEENCDATPEPEETIEVANYATESADFRPRHRARAATLNPCPARACVSSEIYSDPFRAQPECAAQKTRTEEAAIPHRRGGFSREKAPPHRTCSARQYGRRFSRNARASANQWLSQALVFHKIVRACPEGQFARGDRNPEVPTRSLAGSSGS